MSEKEKPPSIKAGDCSHGSIRNNSGFFIELENSEKVEVTHNTVNQDNQLFRGKGLKEVYIYRNQQRSPQALEQFVSEASKHFHELTAEQQKGFCDAVESLRDRDTNRHQAAYKWLYDLSMAIQGSAMASIILSFLGL